MRLPKWLGSPLVIIGLILVLLSFTALEIIQWRKRRQIQVEIDHIVQQQREYQQKNQDLEDSLSLLNSKNYVERMAREQLNLKKEGEIVINFPPPLPPAAASVQVSGTNPQKWWHYFFGNN